MGGVSSQHTLISHHSMCAGPGCQQIIETSAQSFALLSSDLPCPAQASPCTNNSPGIFYLFFSGAKITLEQKMQVNYPASSTAKGVFSYVPLALILGYVLPDKQSCTSSCSFHETSEQIRMFALHNNFLSLSHRGMSSRAGFASDSPTHNCWALQHKAKGNKSQEDFTVPGVSSAAVEAAASQEGSRYMVRSSTRGCFLSCFLLLPRELL